MCEIERSRERERKREREIERESEKEGKTERWKKERKSSGSYNIG